MGMAIVVVPSGGLPVTESTNGYGLPVTVTSNGYGTPVTIVASGGLPVLGAGGVVVPALWQIFGLRKQLASGHQAIIAAHQFQRVRTLIGFTDGAAAELSNTLTNGGSFPGGIIGNTDDLTIERFGYVVGGTLYPAITSTIVLPGVASGSLANFVNTPPVTIPAGVAGLPVYEEIVYNAATATSKLPFVQSPYCYCLSGEGYETATTSRVGNFGAAIAQNQGIFIGRFMSSATWRRSTTKFNDGVLKLNDSIGQGAAAPFFAYDARGNIGFMQQMLDNATGGRKQYLDFGMYATSTQTNNPLNGWEAPVEFLKRVLDNLGPFHIPCVVNQHSHNDSGSTFNGFKVSFNGLRDYVRTNFGNPKWVQMGLTGLVASSDYHTSLAGQTTSGAWTNAAGTYMRQVRDWFAAGADGQIDAYIPHHLAVHDADGARFTDNTAKGTLAVALTANNTATVVIDTVSGNFAIGQLLVFEPIDGTNFDVDRDYSIRAISGAGAQKTVILQGLAPFDRRVQKAHAVGAAVSSRILPDQEHFPADQHDRMRDYCLPLKAAAFALAA